MQGVLQIDKKNIKLRLELYLFFFLCPRMQGVTNYSLSCNLFQRYLLLFDGTLLSVQLTEQRVEPMFPVRLLQGVLQSCPTCSVKRLFEKFPKIHKKALIIESIFCQRYWRWPAMSYNTYSRLFQVLINTLPKTSWTYGLEC